MTRAGAFPPTETTLARSLKVGTFLGLMASGCAGLSSARPKTTARIESTHLFWLALFTSQSHVPGLASDRFATIVLLMV
jgi:hypothetical protein